MPLGLSNLYIIHDHGSFEDTLKLISSPFAEKAGYFELVDNDVLKLDSGRVKALKGFVETGIRFAVHSTYDGVNIASVDPRRRKSSVAAVRRSLEWAASLEALNVVVHPGEADVLEEKAACFGHNVTSLLELKDHSVSLGVRMAVENDVPHRRGLVVKPEDFKRLFEEAQTTFPVVLDAGHAHLSGTTDGFMRTLADSVAEVHVHDNEGTRDQHLAIGSGSVDFTSLRLLFFRPNVLFTVESVYSPFESFDRLAELRRKSLQL